MITVYGHSDDCIEVEGNHLRDEFYEIMGDTNYLAFSNGVVLTINYDGEWKIRVKSNPNKVIVDIAYPDPDDEDAYTDIATIHDDAEWVVHGNGYAKRTTPKA